MHKVKEFELRDVDGGVHKYISETHPTAEGMPIAWTLMKSGAPALVDAGLAFMGGKQFDTDIGKQVAAGMASTDGPTLARQILARTSRDGKRLDSSGFDDAYGGNYPEMIDAVMEVVSHNHFLPALDRLLARLPQAKATPTPS
jgi:hypothetical protein